MNIMLPSFEVLAVATSSAPTLHSLPQLVPSVIRKRLGSVRDDGELNTMLLPRSMVNLVDSSYIYQKWWYFEYWETNIS